MNSAQGSRGKLSEYMDRYHKELSMPGRGVAELFSNGTSYEESVEGLCFKKGYAMAVMAFIERFLDAEGKGKRGKLLRV